MKREALTDEQVEEEIDRLLNSDDVKLAKQEARIKNKRRQYMYKLRGYERRGKELVRLGINADNMEAVLFGGMEDED